MNKKPRHRVATDQPLQPGGQAVLEGNAAHYLSHVLRLGEGDGVVLFNRQDGEWLAHIAQIQKKRLVLALRAQTRTHQPGPDFWVCFAPIKGGRLETIIEKATELGASLLQPVLTQRSIVDKVNTERAQSIAREAAEQCERIDWPEIREPLKLEKLLGSWPKDRLLVYGDETGAGISVTQLERVQCVGVSQAASESETRGSAAIAAKGGALVPPSSAEGVTKSWAILAGPEGGFTPEELAMLRHAKFATGVSLGPRILRADTAIITLSALTLAAWGDWHQPPRFEGTDA
jgi:16S rRNA (uracil1498-N3)-methyltransferase